LFHACLNIGLNKLTKCLNKEVASKVAATETKAVVAAVTKISPLGTGTSISVPGTSNVCTSGGFIGGVIGGFGLGLTSDSVVFIGLTPGGGLRSLGGTTKGL
jgi:hypothetical protein